MLILSLIMGMPYKQTVLYIINIYKTMPFWYRITRSYNIRRNKFAIPIFGKLRKYF